MTVTLWPHQQAAVDAAVTELADGGRAQVIMACGTGKTFVAAESAARLAPAGRVLICVPSLELLAQTAADVAGRPGAGRIVAVCSDDTATLQAEQAHAELAGLHAPVTTDAQTLAELTTGPGRLTVLSTYQSLPTLAAAHHDYDLPGWDLAIADEAHRTAGLTGRAWAAIHDDRRIPARRRLYLTATPRTVGESDQDAVSMDDPAVYGREVYRLSFADAIDAGHLADYRVLVSVITDTEVARLVAGQQLVTAAARAVPGRMLAAQIALLKAIREYGLRRVITYHGRVLAAKRFAATIPDAIDLLPPAEHPPTKIDARWIAATVRPGDRRRILARLREPDGTTVVANCRVLTEGVDVPALDAVMFADPRDSTTDVVQAVGRALRRGADTSKVATIIVPVLIGDGENPDAAADGSEWTIVWRVIRALRAHDERLNHDLTGTRLRLRSPDGPGQTYLPPWLHVEGIDVTPDFWRAVQLRMLRSTTLYPTWREWCAHLIAYRDTHGHANPPADYRTPDGAAVGKWLADQRGLYRKRQLPAERVATLEGLGVDWHPDESAWQVGLRHAAAFRAEHGHLDVPMRHQAPDGYRLGDWLVRQRIARRSPAGARRALTADKIAALDALGMVWDPAEQSWQSWLQQLRAYRLAHGTADVPRDHVTADGAALGSWLSQQRHRYHSGTLAPDKAATLTQEGVTWRPTESAFTVGLSHLAEYRRTFGHARVPAEYVTADGYRLGKWVSRQRGRRRQVDGRRGLTTPQIMALDELEMHW